MLNNEGCAYAEGGECDDPDCGARRAYVVEETRTIRYLVRAHDDDEATDIAQNCQVSVDDPSSDELIAFETRYGAHPSFGPQRPVAPVVWKQLVGEAG